VTVVALVVLAAAMAAITVAHATTVVRRAHPAPRLTGKTVVVNSDHEQPVRGIVAADHSDRIILREAIFVAGGTEHPAGGLVHIPRARISTIQEPEAE
jgi:hypothetical protein